MPELVTSRHGLISALHEERANLFDNRSAEQSKERSDDAASANETVSTVHQLSRRRK